MLNSFLGNNIKRKFYQRRKNLLRDRPSIKNIAVIYYIPKSNTEKYNNWEDGFTKAIELLSEDFNVTWINLEDRKPLVNELNEFDFLIIKSCWNWVVDNYIKSLKGLKTIKGIVVSCSKPPKANDIWRYDVIWYQTTYYEKFVNEHPNIYLGFGINSDTFKPLNLKKEIDVLSIGAITGYKRFEKLNEFNGRRVILGSKDTKDYDVIKDKLDSEIEIINYVTQQELATYINKSKLVYLPCEIEGGGERAVLESLSCGVPVKVEPDNPKLMGLVERFSKRPNTKYHYYNPIITAIKKFDLKKVYSTIEIKSSKNLIAGRYSFYKKNFKIKGHNYVNIGSFCSFGENITFITENHDTNYASTQGFIYRFLLNKDHPGEEQVQKSSERTKGPINIGNDVWIGDGVIILSGVSVGDGACIAAGSIVTKDVKPYSVVAGVPAKTIKERFNDEIIKLLLEIKWWEWTDAKISRNKDFFNLNLNNCTVEEILRVIKE